MTWFVLNNATSVTHQFWITEPITDRHPLKVNFHLGTGVVFMDVVRNGRNILPCVRLFGDREKFTWRHI